jgi:hypothetical protein
VGGTVCAVCGGWHRLWVAPFVPLTVGYCFLKHRLESHFLAENKIIPPWLLISGVETDIVGRRLTFLSEW